MAEKHFLEQKLKTLTAILVEEPSQEFFVRYEGICQDVVRPGNMDGSLVTFWFFDITESDQEIIRNAKADLVEEGFVQIDKEHSNGQRV